MRSRFSLAVVFLTVLAASAADVLAQSKGFESVERRMRQAIEKHKISGAVTLVAQGGKVVHLQPVGRRRLDPLEPMTNDTVFAIASMTKPITATAIMILQDEGKLSVDDPVAKYIPDFAAASLGKEKLKRPITLKDLLTHTSGLGGSQEVKGSLEKTAVELASRKLSFQPGERWQYSPGLNVCGRVVEIVSNQPFEEFLAKRIFEPLGMTDTTFTPNEEQKARLAQLYRPGKDKKSLVAADHWINDLSQPRPPNPSGGLFSTATDMARFYQMILDGGRWKDRQIVSSAAVKQMTSPQTGELRTGFTPGNGWGLGWCVVRKPQGTTAMLSAGTFGHGGAFGTQGWVDPASKTIFVLMIQRTGFGNSDASDLRRDFQRLAVKALSSR